MFTQKNKPDSEQTLRAYGKALDLFFTTAGGFKQARATLKKLLYYAFSEDATPVLKEIPVLRSLQKGFNELMEITYQVVDTGVFNTIPPHKDVFTIAGNPRSALYFDSFANALLTPWDHYPHFLGRKEFINPYGFFEKFFAYENLPGWKIILEELFHAALLHQSIIDFSGNISNAILLQDFLFKFMEAAHLIKVRQSECEIPGSSSY